MNESTPEEFVNQLTEGALNSVAVNLRPQLTAAFLAAVDRGREHLTNHLAETIVSLDAQLESARLAGWEECREACLRECSVAVITPDAFTIHKERSRNWTEIQDAITAMTPPTKQE